MFGISFRVVFVLCLTDDIEDLLDIEQRRISNLLIQEQQAPPTPISFRRTPANNKLQVP